MTLRRHLTWRFTELPPVIPVSDAPISFLPGCAAGRHSRRQSVSFAFGHSTVHPMKTNCKRCGAEILTMTSDSNSGMCAICGRTASAIAWRRSSHFIWICLVLPALVIAFVVWQLSQRQWVWGWALPVLVPLLLHNFKRRTSTEPPPC